MQVSTQKYLSMKSQQLIIVFSFVFMPFVAHAEAPKKTSLLSRIQDTLSQTWKSADYELYIPVNAWHNRRYYSAEKIDSFNEQPWGLGLGKYRYDNDGDWHGLYAMAFLDSHNDIEPVAGYGFQKIWHANENARLGLGYTVAVTSRQDYSYLPIPIVLPLASMQYKKFAIQSTYVPSGHGNGNGNGNILFTWFRWQL